MIHSIKDDPVARLMPDERFTKFPPVKIVKATFGILQNNFRYFFKLWLATFFIFETTFFLIYFDLIPWSQSHNPRITPLLIFILLCTGIIANMLPLLPTLHIALGKTYKTCNMAQCTCWGYRWFNTCTCGHRFIKVGFWSLLSLSVTFSPIINIVFVRLVPVSGALAAGLKNPISSSWHLTRGSFWRLFWGEILFSMIFYLVSALFTAVFVFVVLTFVDLISSSTFFFLIMTIVMLVSLLWQIFKTCYVGLAFRFFYETRITPSKKNARKRSSIQKNKRTKSNAP